NSRADGGVFLDRRENTAGAGHARLRARSENGVAAWRPRRPHDFAHATHARRARRRRRYHASALLRRGRFLYRLRCRGEGVHGCRGGRHWLGGGGHGWGGWGWPAPDTYV